MVAITICLEILHATADGVGIAPLVAGEENHMNFCTCADVSLAWAGTYQAETRKLLVAVIDPANNARLSSRSVSNEARTASFAIVE